MNMTTEFICCKCQLRTPIEQAVSIDRKQFCEACYSDSLVSTLYISNMTCANENVVEVKPGEVPGRLMTPLEWANQNGANDPDGSKLAALLGGLLGK